MESENEPPQERVWNGYGHAMGAAIGLELVLRIANLTARYREVEESRTSEGNKAAQLAKLHKNAGTGMFSGVVAQFCELYPLIVDSDPLFFQAIMNAVEFRNHLAHGFLAGRIGLMQSERGMDLIALECHEAMDHFQRIENYVRQHAGVNFGLFGADADVEAQIANHPLASMLDG